MENRLEKHSNLFIEIMPKGNFVVPRIAKQGSIGYDLVVPEDFIVPARSRVCIPMNFAINLPVGLEAKIEARSGFSLKGIEGVGKKLIWKRLFGVLPYPTVEFCHQRFDADVLPGKIDPFYTDAIGVIIKNYGGKFIISKGTRIAQMTFYSVVSPEFMQVNSFDVQSRGGGFGSSGIKI